MITTINLLPWREERRKQRQRQFVMMLMVAAVLAGLLFWGWKTAVENRISSQQVRNAHIEKEIAGLDKKIREIKDIEERRGELVARMEVIQGLQGNRPTIVHVFDQLARTLPDGVYYTAVERSGKSYTLHGVAESNSRISTLMRNLSASPWFRNPNLLNVKALSDTSSDNSFLLIVQQDSPHPDAAEDDGSDEGEGQ